MAEDHWRGDYMYSVSKTFQFCYGHRLLDDPGKCRGLHGHTAKVTIVLESDELDDLGMVHHFDVIKQKVGKWIEQTLDHRMLLSKKDPLVELLQKAGERPVLLDNNPTAENIAKLIFDHAKEAELPVKEVELWESPTAQATYKK